MILRSGASMSSSSVSEISHIQISIEAFIAMLVDFGASPAKATFSDFTLISVDARLEEISILLLSSDQLKVTF
jgi:hypothetical protein